MNISNRCTFKKSLVAQKQKKTFNTLFLMSFLFLKIVKFFALSIILREYLVLRLENIIFSMSGYYNIRHIYVDNIKITLFQILKC